MNLRNLCLLYSKNSITRETSVNYFGIFAGWARFRKTPNEGLIIFTTLSGRDEALEQEREGKAQREEPDPWLAAAGHGQQIHQDNSGQ
jgi:hypothetical protein